MDAMAGIEELMKELSPEHQREALNFVTYLLQKQKRNQAKPLRQTWAGALRRYRDTYTALELQNKSLSWRNE
jgi:phage tail tape-measure protein